MKKMLVIDGNSIINRAYYAIKPLTTASGIPTNGIFGFMNIFLKAVDEQKPDYVCVAFDLKAPTFRHKEYELYKAQRKGMPDDLAAQMPHLKELLDAMGVMRLECEGYEADDIIGTVSRICEEEKIECDILSGDKDDLQLASDTTAVLLVTTRMGQTSSEVLFASGVFEKYGVTPKEFLQVKGLMGDTSDNIPGVSGIGEKTAFDLIKRFHSIDGVYENIDSPDIKNAARNHLKDGRDSAQMSLRLATICRTVPLDFDISKAGYGKFDSDAMYKKLSELELKKLIERFSLEPSAPVIPEAGEMLEADNEIISKLDSLDFIVGERLEFSCGGKRYVTDAEKLKNVFEDESIGKTTCDVKSAYHALDKLGINLSGIVYDVSLAEYILDPARKSYAFFDLCEKYVLSVSAASLSEMKARQMEEIEENGQKDLLYSIELPLARVLFEMEKSGFRADREELEKFGKTLGGRISELEEAIYFMAGEEFNINSTKQLGQILFEKMGLPAVKKTKSGYSTDSDVLEKLRGRHEIIEYIIEYRHLMKLKSTYADGLVPLIHEDGKLHSTLNQTVTTTGRISSSDPNLQNIPVRTELGRELRKMFIASDSEHILLDADYSQIELRVLAHIADDENMRAAFLSGEDIHTVTASQMFNVPEFLVTPEMRSRAKAVNFGIVYGQSDFSLAQDWHIPVKEAKAYIASYFEKYSGVKAYLDGAVENAKKNGYVTTIFNRRRYIPELSASNFNLRSFGERVAMNAPIQGSAADIIKIAMVNVYFALKKECPRSRLIMQVHDELIVEAHREEAEAAAKILQREMENAAHLTVPLVAEVKSGESWYEAK